jgi:microcystin-dependent protein
MSTPYMNELKLVAFNFAPKGWSMCNGQFLPINQNQALFSLLGTTYGGNGQTTFALPDLRGRVPIHEGAGFTLGQQGGQYTHTLTMSEMPAHNHFMNAINANANNVDPTNGFFANTTGNLTIYGPLNSAATMVPNQTTNFGGSQPHTNQSPYLVMTWIIALQGIFPSQN